MKRLVLAALLIAAPLVAQDTTGGRGRGGRGGPGRGGGGGGAWTGEMDSLRARQLYVSKLPSDIRGCTPDQCARQIANKRRTDSIYTVKAPGKYEFQKVKYKSRADGLEIPAYVFSPINKGNRKHAGLLWVHGNLHGDWDTGMFPFVVEAVQRGYVVITPDYRGSTGYGDEWLKKIDYGGKEIDDVLSAVDYLATLPYVDTNRLGVMGWSHGGFITSHILFRDDNPFKAGAAIVPVTNLVFRLSDHGPSYARDYAAEEGIQGLPFERNCGPEHNRDCIDIYLERSPVFHVDNLKVPMLVARRDERLRRLFPRGPADGLHAHGAQTKARRDEDLQGSAAGAVGLRPHVHPACESERRWSATIHRSRSIRGIGCGPFFREI